MLVRLMIAADGTGQLAVKVGESQKNPSQLTAERENEVSKEEVARFLQLLEGANFWSLQTNQFYTREQVVRMRAERTKYPKAVMKVLGGVHWVLEGAQGENYHVVTRTSPEPGPYANLTSYLFRNLAKLEVPPYREPAPRRK
jgi:hypothetical protein